MSLAETSAFSQAVEIWANIWKADINSLSIGLIYNNQTLWLIIIYNTYRVFDTVGQDFLWSSKHSLSKTLRGWKFGLKGFQSLRSKAYKVIQEILPKIWAQFAFKLGHANFPTSIICLPEVSYLLPDITELA